MKCKIKSPFVFTAISGAWLAGRMSVNISYIYFIATT